MISPICFLSYMVTYAYRGMHRQINLHVKYLKQICSWVQVDEFIIIHLVSFLSYTLLNIGILLAATFQNNPIGLHVKLLIRGRRKSCKWIPLYKNLPVEIIARLTVPTYTQANGSNYPGVVLSSSHTKRGVFLLHKFLALGIIPNRCRCLKTHKTGQILACALTNKC